MASYVLRVTDIIHKDTTPRDIMLLLDSFHRVHILRGNIHLPVIMHRLVSTHLHMDSIRLAAILLRHILRPVNTRLEVIRRRIRDIQVRPQRMSRNFIN
jgi:hypothetical protein